MGGEPGLAPSYQRFLGSIRESFVPTTGANGVPKCQYGGYTKYRPRGRTSSGGSPRGITDPKPHAGQKPAKTTGRVSTCSSEPR